MSFNYEYWVSETTKEMKYQGILSFDKEEYEFRKYLEDDTEPAEYRFVTEGRYDNNQIRYIAIFEYNKRDRVAELKDVSAEVKRDDEETLAVTTDTSARKKTQLEEEIRSILQEIKEELISIVEAAKTDE